MVGAVTMAHNTFRFHIHHWCTDNQTQVAGGGLTFWIAEAALTTWRNTQPLPGSGCPRI